MKVWVLRRHDEASSDPRHRPPLIETTVHENYNALVRYIKSDLATIGDSLACQIFHDGGYVCAYANGITGLYYEARKYEVMK